MKWFRRLFAAAVAVALAWMTVGAVREQGWRAVAQAFVDALPIIAVIGGLFAFLALMNRHESRMQKRFYRRGTRTVGTIVGVDGEDGAGYVVTATFTVDGRSYRAASRKLADRPKKGVGDPVPVYYNPQQPEDSCILDGDLTA